MIKESMPPRIGVSDIITDASDSRPTTLFCLVWRRQNVRPLRAHSSAVPAPPCLSQPGGSVYWSELAALVRSPLGGW